jgi:hypothetical protein
MNSSYEIVLGRKPHTERKNEIFNQIKAPSGIPISQFIKNLNIGSKGDAFKKQEVQPNVTV